MRHHVTISDLLLELIFKLKYGHLMSIVIGYTEKINASNKGNNSIIAGSLIAPFDDNMSEQEKENVKVAIANILVSLSDEDIKEVYTYVQQRKQGSKKNKAKTNINKTLN